MEKSSFFNSVMNGNRPDRVYLAEDFARYFNSFIGNGVFPNPSTSLQVMANDDMTVTLKAGKGWINGYFYVNTDDLVIPIEMADGLRHRIDRIVLRLDLNNRWVKAVVKKGKLDTNPIPPELQRGDNIYELGLAEVKVGKGDISIGQSQIKDTRASSELCGWVTGVVDQVDTETLFKQYESWYKDTTGKAEADLTNLKEQFKKDIDEFTDNYTSWFVNFTGESEKEFNNWFDTIKNILDDNVASKLLQAIEDLKNSKADKDYVDEKISRTSTIVIANYDSHENSKKGADIVIEKGENASEKINEAIQSLKGTGGEVKLMEGNYNLEYGIAVNVDGVHLTGVPNATVLIQNINWKGNPYNSGRKHIIDTWRDISENTVEVEISHLYIKGKSGVGDRGFNCVGYSHVRNCSIEGSSGDSFSCWDDTRVTSCISLNSGRHGFSCAHRSQVVDCISTNSNNVGFNCNDYAKISNSISENSQRNGFVCWDTVNIVNCTSKNSSEQGYYINENATVINSTSLFNMENGFYSTDNSKISGCTSEGNGDFGFSCFGKSNVVYNISKDNSSYGFYCANSFGGICSINTLINDTLNDNSTSSAIVEYNIVKGG